MRAARRIGGAALVGLLAVGLAACGASKAAPHTPAASSAQTLAAPTLLSVAWRGKYAAGCGPASLAPAAFERGDRVAYIARGAIGNTVTIGVLRGAKAVDVLAGPRPGGQAILPGGVRRVVVLSRGCWSVVREERPHSKGHGHSSVSTLSLSG